MLIESGIYVEGAPSLRSLQGVVAISRHHPLLVPSAQTGLRNRSWFPPFANCAKDGVPTEWVNTAKIKSLGHPPRKPDIIAAMNMISDVRDWMDKTGYPLEMRTASEFRVAGFEVRQSSYYTDPETSKPREIDVEVISKSLVGLLDVRCFVECKSSEKPWVLLASADTLTNYNRIFAFATMSVHARNIFAQSDGFYERLEKYPWLKKDGVVAAYSLRQAFSNEKANDVAYAAAMNVTKACYQHISTKSFEANLHIAFPVIVVDTDLIRCTLDSHGEIELQLIEEGEFLFTGHEAGTCIRIVTMAHLPIFAREAKRVAQQLADDFEIREKEMFEETQNRLTGTVRRRLRDIPSGAEEE